MLSLLIQFAILIYSVILHEIAHGWAADRLGDPTARLSRRLTLNPIPHIDPMMTIGLPLILFLTGAGVIFGAAKPIPIDPFNFREPKKDIALTALAGPLTNIFISVVFALLFRAFPNDILSTAVVLNLGLALFNLLPIPPLDGFKVLLGVLPNAMAASLAGLERFGFTLIFIVLFFFPSIIFGTIYPTLQLISNLLLK